MDRLIETEDRGDLNIFARKLDKSYQLGVAFNIITSGTLLA